MDQTASGSADNVFRSMSSNERYKGMIEQSFYKRTRNSLFELFDYIAQTEPQIYALHAFIGAWRIVQLFGAALVADNTNFWLEGTAMSKIINFVSVLFHLMPTFFREDVRIVILMVFIITFVLIFIFILASSRYFNVKQKLPRSITLILSITLSTYGYIMPVVAMNYLGELIGKVIEDTKTNLNTLNIAVIACSFVVMLIYLWIFHYVYAVTIIFKPDSLMTVIPSTQTGIFLMTIVITLILGVAAELDHLASMIVNTCAAPIYFGSTFIYFQKGGLVHNNHMKSLTATSLTGGILLIIVTIFMAVNQYASEAVLPLYFGLWISIYFLTSLYINTITRKKLIFLDILDEDDQNFDMIKSSRQLSDLIVTGFRMAHPVCLSWKLFKYGIKIWPKHIDLWVLYAKFVSIYPEETQHLSFISIGMYKNHLKGSLAKHAMSQISSILKQREANLSPSLKTKTDKISKQVQQTKHKVRYIWDLILQGNINELESVINQAYVAIDTCETEFYHILRQYPNNRFVARSYSRFLRDVIADHAEHKIWKQNITSLQRGVPISPDQAHQLGIRSFPLLPDVINVVTVSQQTFTETGTMTQEIEIDDDQEAYDAELRASIKENIYKLKIPSFKEARLMRIMLFFFLFFAPVIVFCIFTPMYISMISEPLDYIFQLSNARNLLFQITGTNYRYVCENIVAHDPVSNITFYPLQKNTLNADEFEPPPENLGGTYEPRIQTGILINMLSDILPKLSPLMSFKPGSKEINFARILYFKPSVNYRYVSEPIFGAAWSDNDRNYDNLKFDITPKKTPVQLSMVQFILVVQEELKKANVSKYALLERSVTETLNNVNAITTVIGDIIQVFLKYVSNNDDDLVKYLRIANILSCILIPTIYIIFSIIIMKHITRDKLVIYRCLTSLPKNVASKVADSFKVLKNEDDEMKSKSNSDELNKQEENILKIFAASSDSGYKNTGDKSVLIIVTIIMITLFVIYVTLCLQFYTSSAQQLKNCAPHIDYFTSAYSYELASVILYHLIPSAFCELVMFNVINFNKGMLRARIKLWQDRAEQYYRLLRYGDEDNEIVPFQTLGINIADETNSAYCKGYQMPGTYHDVYSCLPADLLLSNLRMQIKSQIDLLYTNNVIYTGENHYLVHMWHIMQVHLYNQYFAPRFQNIIGLVLQTMQREVPFYTAVPIAILVVALITEIFLLRAIDRSEAMQKFALRLLLHCPGSAIVENQNITAILAGHFSRHNVDSTARGHEFYDNLVKEMPDCVIILDLNGKIVSANKSTKRIFNVDEEEIVGENIEVIGNKFISGNPFENTFDPNRNIQTEDKSFIKEDAITKGDGTKVHLEINLTALPESMFAIFRDITQTVMYNQLISDERAKSDSLLSSILPARLVPRVQAGEENISFAVQTVSVLFQDIVSFTPWCGSLPASTVMSTLNALFKEWDALVSTHPTITKIKCIGDCYMCAGGIFADVNQPAVHAKDTVEFGLEAIEAVNKINKEIGQSLKIRVGINTGGPVVAGVLGTEKPTFEILGPTINMAQQMEHHGIPMKVHVSRAVYELIYGGHFIVKERGEVAIKNGTTVTYLIDGIKE